MSSMNNTTGNGPKPRSQRSVTTIANSPIHQATGEVPANSVTLITPKQLGIEFGIPGTHVRRVLRAHFKDSHVLRESWGWEPDSKELAEARSAISKALAAKKAKADERAAIR